MGYASTIPFSLTEISSQIEGNVTFTTVASKEHINPITTPNYHFPLTYAYLDVIAQGMLNSFVGSNYMTNSTYTGLTSGGIDRHASDPDNFFIVESDGFYSQYLVIPGVNNLASYLSPDTSYDCFIYGETAQNQIELRNVYSRLRLYFGV